MMLTQYQLGEKNGKADKMAGISPRSSRLWQRDYRIGYSDGYWKAKGKPKKW